MIKQIFSVCKAESDKRLKSSWSVWKSVTCCLLSQLTSASEHMYGQLVVKGHTPNIVSMGQKIPVTFCLYAACLLSLREKARRHFDFGNHSTARCSLISFLPCPDFVLQILSHGICSPLYTSSYETGLWLQGETFTIEVMWSSKAKWRWKAFRRKTEDSIQLKRLKKKDKGLKTETSCRLFKVCINLHRFLCLYNCKKENETLHQRIHRFYLCFQLSTESLDYRAGIIHQQQLSEEILIYWWDNTTELKCSELRHEEYYPAESKNGIQQGGNLSMLCDNWRFEVRCYSARHQI